MPGQLNLAGSRPPASGLDVDWTQIDRRKFLSYGSISVFLVRFLVFPFSLVKTRMQTGRTGSQRVFKTIGEIASKEGFRALYSGFSVSIFGAIPAQLVYISAYELVKSKVANLAAEGKLGVGTDEAARALVSNLMGGAAASLASQVVVVPVDVVAQRYFMTASYISLPC